MNVENWIQGSLLRENSPLAAAIKDEFNVSLDVAHVLIYLVSINSLLRTIRESDEDREKRIALIDKFLKEMSPEDWEGST